MSGLLELENAHARLGGVEVLNGASFVVRPGEVVALCGPNGAGKSTAVRAALGLTSLTQGTARLGDHEARRLSERQRGERAAYLPQDRSIAWNLPAVEVAALGAPFLTGGAALERARAALDEVGVGHLADRGVADMSGGERARVLLARALTVPALSWSPMSRSPVWTRTPSCWFWSGCGRAQTPGAGSWSACTT
ncbi:ABC transporter ATP-binding protein [Brevundimonas sp. LF-1]|uniref:ABC transporter ATP-binding protein n=1 Tax=Brevundimonas sp. LF-1 TaxID=3126100 RepID=UPI0030E0A06F